MLRKKTIQRFVAALLLLVFGFSITPKKTLHDLVATHKDSPIKATTTQVETTGFHCQFENLVVESPFLNDFSPFSIAVVPELSVLVSSPEPGYISVPVSDASLRGPPAI